MSIRIHHLNCGSMQVLGAPLVCHVLLLETTNGLVLVDAGFGTHEIAEPEKTIGPSRVVLRPSLIEEETALYQVKKLGFKPEAVKHIILTHFDVDHVGGLSDFPHATVHASDVEVGAAFYPQTFFEHHRYNSLQWSYDPKVVGHEAGDITWHGFEGATKLSEIDDNILLIPMVGHSRGHAAVAINTGSGWLLHVGDAFFHHGRLDGSRVPVLLRLSEYALAFDRTKMYDNVQRLHDLYAQQIPGLTIFNAHDPTLLEAAKALK